MTNRNTPLNNLPFLLQPVGKAYLWGGTRLNDDFSKGIPLYPLAETWECSTHPDGLSVVGSGEHTGQTLRQVLHERPDYLGRNNVGGELPILIKLIDAKENLSVQVHPDDAYARDHENGALGKTEMWYVLDAEKDAQLIYGLYYDTSEQALRRGMEEGTIDKYLQKVKIKKNDVFYIEAGTIHAIGAGALIAEIQENSNITYRLYDYDRTDKDGNKRPLHPDKALAVANRKSSAEPMQPMRVLRYRQGWVSELLCRCRHFQVERVILNTERCRTMVPFQTNDMTFRVLLCVDGCGTLYFGDENLPFFKGDCVFVPADSAPIRIHGNGQMLTVSC